MKLTDVKRQIIENTLGSFYIFSGEEIEIQNIYVRKIAEVKHQVVKRIDSVSEILKSRGISLFSQSFCYVCRDDTDFMKAEKLWDKMDSLLGQNTLIVQVTTPDKRSKFFHHFEGNSDMPFGDVWVTFSHLDPYLLRKYIRQQVEMPKDICDRLIDVCEGDYNRMMLELDKVKQMSHTEEWQGVVASSILGVLLDDGTIAALPQDVIFDWVAAVLAGKPRLAFRLYEECQKSEEPVLRLLLVLYNNVKQLLQVQSCDGNIAETTGLSGWEIRNVKEYVGVYTNRELVNAMKLIKQQETAIKNGQVEEQFVVPYIMTSMIGGY